MKRMQLFEFEDLPWFPNFLRQPMTRFLITLHRLLRTPDVIAPLLLRVLQRARTQEIIDLCSGAGGAMPAVGRRLREAHGVPVRITLSDLYPHVEAMQAYNGSGEDWLRYETRSVDAGRVEQERRGVRTMICSFHHMPPAVAKSILKDAFEKRQPLFIFEISDNSFPRGFWWTAFPTVALLVFFITPWIRPFTFKQFFFTYVIPLLPLLIAWDGAASNARTYPEADMQEFLKDLQAPDYAWEIGRARTKTNPGPMLYVIGQRTEAKA